MICTHCNYDYPKNAQYCAQCGGKTLYNPTLNAVDKNVVAVWLYVGVNIFTSVVWHIISMVIVPRAQKVHDWEKITKIYEIWGVVSTLILVATCVAVIVIIRNVQARAAVGVYAFFTLVFYIISRIAAGI